MRRNSWFAMVVVAAMPLVCAAGWEFTSVTTGDGAQSNMMNMVVKGWTDGDRARMEFTSSGNPAMQAGTYLITKDAGATMYMVNPQDKSYATWDMAAMMGMAGGAMKMMGMKYTQPKIEKLLEEDGGKVAGFSTKHYRFRTSYATEMKFLGRKMSTATTEEQDIWATTKLSDAGMRVWLKNRDFKTGNEEFDALVKAQMDKVEGFPLKNVSVHTTKDAKGVEQTTRTTMEVTQIREAKPSAALFEIPAGYTEQSLLPPGVAAPVTASGSKTPDASDASVKTNVQNAVFQMLQRRINRGR